MSNTVEVPTNNGFKLFWAQDVDEIYAGRNIGEVIDLVEFQTGEQLLEGDFGEVTHDHYSRSGESLFQIFKELTIREVQQVWTGNGEA